MNSNIKIYHDVLDFELKIINQNGFLVTFDCDGLYCMGKNNVVYLLGSRGWGLVLWRPIRSKLPT